MRKLIESTLVSLDGVIEAPERWANFDAEATALSLEQLGNYDAFVMGRVTYDKFFANWGHLAGNPYIDLINTAIGYVAPFFISREDFEVDARLDRMATSQVT